ncbi:AAA family ATPase [Streptomyces spororaveus]|uniref:AAA family ATPase n=1 Tax=Streptomyces spororaveus TaxID=284039 RepID=UPI0037A82144
MQTGIEETRLIFLRGNAGSGKTTVARRVQQLYGHGLAVIEQDMFRDITLRETGVPGPLTRPLLATAARQVLDSGHHLIVEGLLTTPRWEDVLAALAADHRGRTFGFYFAVPFDETVRRHSTRHKATMFGAAEMREWWREEDRLTCLVEETVDHTSTVEESASRILKECGLTPGSGCAL